MRYKYICVRKKCDWRNPDGSCLMAHRCPTGDRFRLPAGTPAVSAPAASTPAAGAPAVSAPAEEEAETSTGGAWGTGNKRRNAHELAEGSGE